MWRYSILIACLAAGLGAKPAHAQKKADSKDAPASINPALEKELFQVELKWMKAEADKKTTGPDSMGELWTDDFFDVLPGGKVVNKQEMMDMMVKSDHKPGTGAFPDTFKLRAVYGNVALATDHTIIKGLDANGNVVPSFEMGVLRMFVKENGKWRVAGAGLVPIPKAK